MGTNVQTSDSTKSTWLAVGSVAAALGASLCCILPVVVAVMGVGSAALGATLEPLRPYLAGVTLLALSYAYYREYRPRKEDCAPGEACAVPGNRRRQRLMLWIFTLVAAALLGFPYYAGWLL